VLERSKKYKPSVEWYEKLFKAAKGEGTIAALPPERTRFVVHAAAELAWIYCEYLPNLKEARKYAKKALDLRPNMPSLLDTMGWILYKENNYPEAIRYLRRAFKDAPTNPTIGYHLAQTLYKNGNAKIAREELDRALKHVGDNAELKEKMVKLRKELGG
jgi:tetratricopeptide (TPR) repeat protein